MSDRNDKKNELENAPEQELENGAAAGGASPEPEEAPEKEAPAAPEAAEETEAASDEDSGSADEEAGDSPEAGTEEAPDEAAALLDEIVAQETADAGDGEDNKGKKKKEKKERVKKDHRKLRYGGMATAVTAIVVVLVIVLNVVVDILADRFPLNLDLTSNQQFSLTENSVEIAQSIDKDVQVTVFMGEDNFQNPSTGTEQLNDLLREFYRAMQQYRTYSDGHVTVEYVDLNLNPTLASDYEQYGDIQAEDVLFVCGDRYRLTNMGEMFEQEADYYSYSYTYTSLVEQTLASNFVFVTREKREVITVFTGHNEMSGGLDLMKDIYELNGYEFAEVNLATATEIDPDTVAGMILAPTTDFTQAEIERLRDWLDNDGKLDRNLVVYAHPTAQLPNLYEFLEVEYGIEVTGNLVVETDSSRILDMMGYTSLADVASTGYTSDFSGEGNIVTQQTRQLILHREGTSEELNPYNTALVTMPETAELLSLATEDGEAATETVPADEYPVVAVAMATKSTYDNDADQYVSTNVMVSGSIYMIAYYSQANVSNEDLLLNTMNTMTGKESDTINVSSKSLESETVTFTQAASTALGLGVFTIGIPVVVLIICLVVFLRRRHL